MRPRKPILVVGTRAELRYTMRISNAHVKVFSAESREELKSHVGCEMLLAVVDSRDMQAKGAEVFVAKVRESFPQVKIVLIRKHGDPRLFGADVALADDGALSGALIDVVKSLAVLKRGPKKTVEAKALKVQVA